MSLDGIAIRAVVRELEETLVGSRAAKIYQPGETDLIFHFRSRGTNRKLLLSAHPAYPRLHLTEQPTDNPLTPPMFCMLLRKHCEGGIVEAVRQVGMERIVHLDIKSRDELGDEVIRRLVVEVMGRHSNIILTDPASGRILDGIRRVTPDVSRHRQVLPGLPYQPPPEQDKQNPLEADRDTFLRALDFNRGKLDKQIVARFAGIGPQTAREIVHRGGPGDRDRLWTAFSEMMEAVRAHRYEPHIVYGKKTVLSVLRLTHLKGERESFDSVSRCLESFYAGKAERNRTRQQNLDLIRNLKNAIDKNEKKIGKLKRELADTEKAETYRIRGELLTAYMHQVNRGDEELKVINHYEEDAPEVTIPLDPRLTPSENAQRYFRLYNKAKSAKKWNTEQLQKAKRENEYLESVLVQLQDAGPREAEEIKEELREEGWIKSKSPSRRKKRRERPKPASYRSSEGFLILVGRNNRQNDFLTHRTASPTDTWLHTKDIPGSHVVIRGTNFGEETLLEAAMLAAWYSKARESSQVPVDYTLIKHVRKPSGAPPGFVIYEEQKTLFVTPDENRIRKLEKSSEE
ncbi:putative ribosome quality control (RQC) complex YloA/Tae2 family protein [Melghirimyces profundicolus]|uniref:Rqc2 homolog RqcH n=1 Tax=Melghirimyces profundicolus TaxID=1242148 RepID=A0A2T6B2N5_9BACL|nr:NFACT RNA binding domain-containing protein [Melghirimyces profundicolus]PTX50338.1 putative ribosome quality control (RQC) complex YloA/Tae2 family protein [Melghirimyces profundicolus]